MKYLCILLISFLFSCINQEKPKAVPEQTTTLDTVSIDLTKNGLSITLNKETAKKIIPPVSGLGLYKTHKQILASSVDDVAKNIRASTLNHISQSQSLSIARNLKKKAANKWMGKFTIVYTVGASAYSLLNNEKTAKAEERFNNQPNKKK